MKRLNEICAVLTDPAERLRYDRSLARRSPAAPAASRATPNWMLAAALAIIALAAAMLYPRRTTKHTESREPASVADRGALSTPTPVHRHAARRDVPPPPCRAGRSLPPPTPYWSRLSRHPRSRQPAPIRRRPRISRPRALAHTHGGAGSEHRRSLVLRSAQDLAAGHRAAVSSGVHRNVYHRVGGSHSRTLPRTLQSRGPAHLRGRPVLL